MAAAKLELLLTKLSPVCWTSRSD